MRIRHLVAPATFIAATMMAGIASAGNLLVNGNFETGTYAGWTTNVEAGSNGNLFITTNNGAPSPDSGFATAVNPNGGNFYSITDQGGPGSYSLTQAFTLASASTVTVSFDQFVNDQAGAIYDNGRDYNTYPNENAEADILSGSADPFTNGPGILKVLYGPGADNLNNNPNPWTSYSDTFNLGAGTYQIRFAETDNQGFFQQGVDNVVVSAGPAISAVPEPSTWLLLIGGIGGIGLMLRQAKKTSGFRFTDRFAV